MHNFLFKYVRRRTPLRYEIWITHHKSQINMDANLTLCTLIIELDLYLFSLYILNIFVFFLLLVCNQVWKKKHFFFVCQWTHHIIITIHFKWYYVFHCTSLILHCVIKWYNDAEWTMYYLIGLEFQTTVIFRRKNICWICKWCQ